MGVNIQFIQGQNLINALPENYWNQEIIESMKICCALSLFFPIPVLVTNAGKIWNELSFVDNKNVCSKSSLASQQCHLRSLWFVSSRFAYAYHVISEQTFWLCKDLWFINDQYKTFSYEVYHWSKQKYHSPASTRTIFWPQDCSILHNFWHKLCFQQHNCSFFSLSLC